ncbi:putative bifunctional diguanylate cyclase/phosphodiesterase [Novosphingobium sp.]|uniref:putative bifunctional diguanylate cyclase/phosphodiesterase n=1 Tax=Novosphingobium sp. TaxID=1874826 RepID=UPI0035671B3F
MGSSHHLADALSGPKRLAATVRRGLGGRWAQRKGDSFTKAYAVNLSHRLPLLYLVVVFNCVLMSLRFQSLTPVWIFLFGPLVIGSFAIWRAYYWLPDRVAGRSMATLRSDLRGMSWLGAASGLVFGLWAMLLSAYGDESSQSFIHYIVAVTLFSGVLGLGHAPLTALRIAFALTIPTSLQTLFSGHSNALEVVLVQTVVTALLLLITNGHHRDFVKLELSRQRLVRRERQAALLAKDNMLQATVDPLTGALNRRAILARLEAELAAKHTGTAAAWLALIDLDGFKHINDTYGHAAGDTVLAAIASRFASVEHVKSYGRLGGDEFAVILDAALDEAAVRKLANDLSDALRAPVIHANAVLRLSGSIGVHRVAGRSASDCLERADAALYKAKEQSDGTVVVFSPDDETELLQRATITRQFNNSNLEQRIKLVYQPIVDLTDNSITGFEAFARWSPDGQSWLTPGQFMSLAVATGRTGEMTRMVLARAMSECRTWEQGRTLSINLAPRDVMRAGTPDVLSQLMDEAGAPPQSIILEVTERALLDDPKRAEAQLKAFRARGFRIALDDFGAGWSSLSQVHSLPLDIIKIDQALSRALASDPGARALVSSIVSLTWQLGIDCTIEGVEDEAQAETARSLGIRLMQGYHFGHPAPAEQAMARLASAA